MVWGVATDRTNCTVPCDYFYGLEKLNVSMEWKKCHKVDSLSLEHYMHLAENSNDTSLDFLLSLSTGAHLLILLPPTTPCHPEPANL